MRTITITDIPNVELWPGRKLYLPGKLLVSLPRGMVDRSGRVLSFGSATKTSVTVTGSQQQVDNLFALLIDAEAPAEGRVTL